MCHNSSEPKLYVKRLTRIQEKLGDKFDNKGIFLPLIHSPFYFISPYIYIPISPLFTLLEINHSFQ